jgi:hypothetical protein
LLPFFTWCLLLFAFSRLLLLFILILLSGMLKIHKYSLQISRLEGQRCPLSLVCLIFSLVFISKLQFACLNFLVEGFQMYL